ncbi:hypothetical protein F1559_003502 [Cyanidiococcus yangmingshanensis]|uniref:ApaG domain-containing protein n=1 Tax=Cyanidiococcus yangmingshanensis TaxID=2690220 RepID=A0A7J7ILH3_9RHOD|nr:hypothetical protein F1559_003502 [Cyanidiococcus yangmingshanensis]
MLGHVVGQCFPYPCRWFCSLQASSPAAATSVQRLLYRALQRALRDYGREWVRVGRSASVLESAFREREWQLLRTALADAQEAALTEEASRTGAIGEPWQLASELRRMVRQRIASGANASESTLELGFRLLKAVQMRTVALQRLVYEPHSICSTAGVQVEVDSLFLGREPRGIGLPGLGDVYHFAYFVRIENRSAEPVLLLGRHWDINDLHGQLQTVRGLGVVGQTPTLDAGTRYEYRSQCVLAAPLGVMRGFYRMLQIPRGVEFTAEIKPFGLIASSLQQEPALERMPAGTSPDTTASLRSADGSSKRPARPPL